MANAPRINTSTWRVRRKTGRTMDDPMPDEAYARVGLPVAPPPPGLEDMKPPKDAPSLDTSSWTLPKKANGGPANLVEAVLGEAWTPKGWPKGAPTNCTSPKAASRAIDALEDLPEKTLDRMVMEIHRKGTTRELEAMQMCAKQALYNLRSAARGYREDSEQEEGCGPKKKGKKKQPPMGEAMPHGKLVVSLKSYKTEHGYVMKGLRIYETPSGWFARWTDAKTHEQFDEEIPRGHVGPWRAAFIQAGKTVQGPLGMAVKHGSATEAKQRPSDFEDDDVKLLHTMKVSELKKVAAYWKSRHKGNYAVVLRVLQAKQEQIEEAKPGKLQQAAFDALEKNGPMGETDLFMAIHRATKAKGPSIHTSLYHMRDKGKIVRLDNGKLALPKQEACGPQHGKKGKKLMPRHNPPTRPAVQMAHKALPDDMRSQMRQLAGLEESRDIMFATGTPYRRMPELAEAAPGQPIGKHEAKVGLVVGTTSIHNPSLSLAPSWVIKKVSKNTVSVGYKDPSGAWARGSKLYRYTWDGSAYSAGGKKNPSKLVHPDPNYYKEADEPEPSARESRLDPHTRAMAGIASTPAVPRPLTDASPRPRVRAHGILDDGEDGGESYIESVLRESRWFLKDFGSLSLGAFDPLGEAPGGRSGPWQGSKDEPAKTPIVRKGKSHGAVGDQDPPEARGEVDVGKSEIDYDHDPGEDEDEVKAKPKKAPPTKKSAARKPPPPDDEVGDDEDESEKAEWAEYSEKREPGSLLKRIGGAAKHAGSRLRTGSAAGRAKEQLKKHLHGFAQKHGIKVSKYHGDDEDEPRGKAPKKSAAAKPKKPMRPKPRGKSPHQKAMAQRQRALKQRAKKGTGPRIKKIKRRIREMMDA